MKMSAIFFSDVHLRDSDSVKTKLFLRFLEKEVSHFEKVFILGDLFDVWPGTDSYLMKRYEAVLSALRAINDAGSEIHFIEGNHDFHLGPKFMERTGIIVHSDSLRTELGGRKVFMVHGDLGNPNNKGYPYLRKFLRADLVHQIKRAVPPRFVFDLGLKSSQISRTYNTKDAVRQAEIRIIYRAAATRLFEQGHEVVLMGHTHLPDRMSANIEGRDYLYFNTGDWVQNFTYLEFVNGEFYTKSHPVKEA